VTKHHTFVYESKYEMKDSSEMFIILDAKTYNTIIAVK